MLRIRQVPTSLLKLMAGALPVSYTHLDVYKRQVWNMLLLYPDYFDAAVTVAGGRVYGNLESIKDIPIWIFHAQNDGTVSVECSRQMYKALTDLDANVFMSEPTTGGHNHNVVAFSSTALYD